MKKILLAALCLITLGACANSRERVIASYVTSWSEVMPDPTLLTHVNYAFGHVKKTFDGVRIDNEQRLRDIVALKAQNPDLKVVLSIGGWGSGNFSEMAADSGLRWSFCSDCARAVAEFGLDGIDIDWEYPASGEGAGISSSPDDRDNFTLLMRDLRKALGKKKLLTLASCCDPHFIDFRKVMKYIDFVNLMTYDMNSGRGDFFHSALYPSENTGRWTTDTSVKAHIKAGVPARRIVMGVPFYGKGEKDYSGYRDFKRIYPLPEGYTEKWDEKALVPYVVNPAGKFVFGFENARSLEIKCDYIRKHKLLGIMNWEYAGDDANLTLTKVMSTLRKQQSDINVTQIVTQKKQVIGR